VRDADAAHQDLDGLLTREGPAAQPEAALLFTCNGRGRHLFGTPDHDAELLSQRLGPIPTAGFFAAGELGPIDVLVNCAGWDELKPFLATDEAFWRRVIAINYEGALRTTHAVLGGMLERRYGRIVNVSSDAARVGSAHEAVYAGAKAAVIAFTKTIARESARRGVTANAVCPGPTDTALLAGMAQAGPSGDQLVAALTRAVPMRRLGRPEDVAGAVAFLAGEDAGYVTGQTLSVSGGLTMA